MNYEKNHSARRRLAVEYRHDGLCSASFSGWSTATAAAANAPSSPPPSSPATATTTTTTAVRTGSLTTRDQGLKLACIGLPPSAEPETVVLYLSALAKLGRHAGTIGLVHQRQGLASSCSNLMAHETLRGIRRKLGMRQRGKERATLELIRKAIAQAEGSLAASRDGALLLAGFAGGLRRSDVANRLTSRIRRVPKSRGAGSLAAEPRISLPKCSLQFIIEYSGSYVERV